MKRLVSIIHLLPTDTKSRSRIIARSRDGAVLCTPPLRTCALSPALDTQEHADKVRLLRYNGVQL